MTTVRWIFHDPVANETWTVPINPDSMSPVDVTKPKTMTFANGWRRDGRVRTFVGKPGAMELEFGGVIRTQAHYLKLVEWAKKTNAIEITDHLGRLFVVYIQVFDPTDRPPTKRVNWRLRYKVKTTLLEVWV